ncbi:hypothetical protein GWI33_010723 [Rhynchophorus ferrugineus]|uniref:Uncharacterized protein n=1 Tax=Rhynchophorus ferrugineus TaxID=354439 RepID=A0A834I962_RHYFE|nr:hypothetical protein GWI33_010723 [Rhynchophorus ferrugineus]
MHRHQRGADEQRRIAAGGAISGLPTLLDLFRNCSQKNRQKRKVAVNNLSLNGLEARERVSSERGVAL